MSHSLEARHENPSVAESGAGEPFVGRRARRRNRARPERGAIWALSRNVVRARESRPRSGADARRAAVEILVPGSVAERASRAMVWSIALAAIIVAAVWPDLPTVASATGWAAPGLGVLVGYRREKGLWPATVAARVWRTLGRPYVAWLALLGLPALAWEFSSSVDAGVGRLRALLWGGVELDAPLLGHWLVAALGFAVLLVALAERWLGVDPVWVLPAALTLTYGGSALAALPLGVGLGAVFVTFILMGHALRRVREHVGWRTGAVLLVLGLAVAVGPGGPLDLRVGQGGTPVEGPLAAGAAAAGLILVAERAVGLLTPSLRQALARTERLAPVALLTFGLGPYLVPPAWPRGVAVPAAVLAAALACAGVAALPHSAWLTGASHASARRARRRFRWRARTTVGA